MDERTIIFIYKNANHVMTWNNDRLVFQQAHIYSPSDMNDLSPINIVIRFMWRKKKVEIHCSPIIEKYVDVPCLEDCT
jgi:hypothetical protein